MKRKATVEQVEAAAEALWRLEIGNDRTDRRKWLIMPSPKKEQWRLKARAALTAALNL